MAKENTRKTCDASLSVTMENEKLHIFAQPRFQKDADEFPKVRNKRMSLTINSKGVSVEELVEKARSSKSEAVVVVPLLNGQLSVMKNGQTRLTLTADPSTAEEANKLSKEWAQQFVQVMNYLQQHGDELSVVRAAQRKVAEEG